RDRGGPPIANRFAPAATRSHLQRDGSSYHGNLTTGIARPVGKEPVVVAMCARRAYRQAPHPGGRRLLGNQRAQIHIARSGGGMASQLFAHFGADLVAASANRWSE